MKLLNRINRKLIEKKYLPRLYKNNDKNKQTPQKSIIVTAS